MAALPLTLNGKLHTPALPAPEISPLMGIGPRLARLRRSWPASTPRSSGLERVGVDDSFFDLGGDSLSAMRVGIAAINTGLDAGPWGARRVRGAHRCPVGAPDRWGYGWLEPSVAVERPAVVPSSFAQNRLWFIDQLQGPSPITLWRWRCGWRGRLDADAFGAAVADVVARHESPRMRSCWRPRGYPQAGAPCRAGRLWLGRR